MADSAPGDGAESVVLAYDGANRILSRGAVAYAHDAAGCVTSISGGAGATPAFASGRRLVWNSRYQLVRVEDGAGALLESYAYDALGRRVSTTDACGSTTFHVYDGMHCIADVSESGVPVVSYVWGPGVDNLLAVVRHGSGGAAERVLYAVRALSTRSSIRPEPQSNATVTTPGATSRATSPFLPPPPPRSTDFFSRAASTRMPPASTTSAPAGTIQPPAAGSPRTPSAWQEA